MNDRMFREMSFATNELTVGFARVKRSVSVILSLTECILQDSRHFD